MFDTQLDELHRRLQMLGVNVERRSVPEVEDEEFLRVVVCTPFQVLEIRVFGDTRKRFVTFTPLSYELDALPEKDPNRMMRLVGHECWIALRHIGEYAQASAYSDNVKDQVIPRVGHRTRE